MDHDWYRCTQWTPQVREAFELRLARARKRNRPQYLRIQGIYLAEADNVPAARELWLRVLDSPAEFADFETPATLEHLGDSWVVEQTALAATYYRRLLDEYPAMKGTTFTAPIKLAELLLAEGGHKEIAESRELLERARQETLLPMSNFRRCLALISLAKLTDDRPLARDAAREALDLAARGPTFAFHPTVGVVETDSKTLRRLRRLAR